jgi:hypothetical protein
MYCGSGSEVAVEVDAFGTLAPNDYARDRRLGCPRILTVMAWSVG